MSHPRTRPGGHVQFDTGEKITSLDLERIGTMAEQGLYAFLARLFQSGLSGNPIQGFPGDDCLVSVSGLDLTVAPGWGLYYDTAATDEFGPIYKPIVVAGETVTLDAHSGSPRIDIVCVAAAMDEDQPSTRSVKAGDGSISSQSVNKRATWSYAIQVVKGTPASSPTAPATPTGYLKLVEAYLPATTGALVLNDTRPRLRWGHDMITDPPADYARNWVPGTSTELLVEAVSGMTIRVLAGEAYIQGYRYYYPRQQLTVSAAHATLTRYDSVMADADGTLQIVAGTPGFGAAPQPDADQVRLTTIEVAATVTTIGSGDITDDRLRTWLQDEHIPAAEISSSKLRTVPIVPSVVFTGPNTVTITMKDWEGNAVARQVNVMLTLLHEDLAVPTLYLIHAVTTGTAVSPIDTTVLFARTNSSGVLVLTLTLPGSGFDLLLKVEPFNTPASAAMLEFVTP